jgi:hypothetical protein
MPAGLLEAKGGRRHFTRFRRAGGVYLRPALCFPGAPIADVGDEYRVGGTDSPSALRVLA